MDDALIYKAAHLLRNANRGVAFTGAGISTPSGIPDFRSPGSGLWNNADVFAVASLQGFRRNPSAFYNWVRPLISLTVNAQPNPAHFAISRWEADGKLRACITQNIDGLHTRAGSKTVYELHGHTREATCQSCRATVPAAPLIADILNGGGIPHCEHCGGVLKPNVILFGEMLPQDQINAAVDVTKSADIILVVGSSLEVSPANEFPLLALQHGAKLIIVNLEPTFIDCRAHVVVHGDAALVLPAIQQAMENVG